MGKGSSPKELLSQRQFLVYSRRCCILSLLWSAIGQSYYNEESSHGIALQSIGPWLFVYEKMIRTKEKK